MLDDTEIVHDALLDTAFVLTEMGFVISPLLVATALIRGLYRDASPSEVTHHVRKIIELATLMFPQEVQA